MDPKSALHALRKKVIPWVQADGMESMILMNLPLHAPPGVRVTRHKGSALQESGRFRSFTALSTWVPEGLNSVRFPYIGFVLEGEADLRMGITERMARESSADRENRFYTLSLPERSYFLFPPGTPCSDANPHWHRPGIETAFSRIFWLHILPSGTLCHICQTERGVHSSAPFVFLADAYLAPLCDLLLDELEARRVNYRMVAHANLLSLLLRAERSLNASVTQAISGSAQAFGANAGRSRNETAPMSQRVEVVQRVRQYIGAHLQENLTLDSIARHSYVSASHLNRTFRAEMGLPIIKFVTQCRVERAKSLLEDTNLPIGSISRMVGYPQPSSFGDMFRQQTGLTPGDYRKHARRSTLLAYKRKHALKK